MVSNFIKLNKKILGGGAPVEFDGSHHQKFFFWKWSPKFEIAWKY
jgi:hypothetical protein